MIGVMGELRDLLSLVDASGHRGGIPIAAPQSESRIPPRWCDRKERPRRDRRWPQRLRASDRRTAWSPREAFLWGRSASIYRRRLRVPGANPAGRPDPYRAPDVGCADVRVRGGSPIRRFENPPFRLARIPSLCAMSPGFGPFPKMGRYPRRNSR